MRTIILAMALSSPTSPAPTADNCLALSQKACREFLFIASGINPPETRASLSETIALFETSLTSIDAAAAKLDDRARARATTQASDVKALWKDIKPIFAAAAKGTEPNDTELGAVATLNSSLHQNLQTLCKTISGTTSHAGLADKMSSEFLFITLGVNAEQHRERLQTSMTTFETAFGKLAPEGAPGKSLTEAKALYTTLQPVFTKATNTGWKPTSGDAALVASAIPSFQQSFSVFATWNTQSTITSVTGN